MDGLMSNLHFWGMTFFFRLRDLVVPRDKVLREVEIRPGDRVLDYGCGPGGYVADTAALVGKSGAVYALDIHPLAVQRVQDLAGKKQLSNVKTICSGCQTGLPDGSVDVVLLYDTFHMLSDPQAILTELHRVLKADGLLSFNDHHMQEREIISGVTSGLFTLSGKGERTYSFVKRGQ